MRYFFALIAALFIFSAPGTTNAQIKLNVNFNLDSQPAWGPTGYDYVENYYLPDMDVYYNVPLHRYYFYNNGRWRYSNNLPYKYHNHDIYNSYKVVINDKSPWKNHKKYRDEYSKYKGHHDQKWIRDSKDSKYFRNKYHPKHQTWVREQKHDNGNSKGNNNKHKKDRK